MEEHAIDKCNEIVKMIIKEKFEDHELIFLAAIFEMLAKKHPSDIYGRLYLGSAMKNANFYGVKEIYDAIKKEDFKSLDALKDKNNKLYQEAKDLIEASKYKTMIENIFKEEAEGEE